MQNRKGIGFGRGRLPGLFGRRSRFGEGAVDRSHDGEGVDRLDEMAIGASLAGQEAVDLAVEHEQHRAFVEIAHLLALTHGEARGHAAHVADLEVEHHEVGIDRTDGRHDVDAGPHSMEHVGAGDGGLDLVGQGVGIGGEKDVRHDRRSYTSAWLRPRFGAVSAAGGRSIEGRVFAVGSCGYDAPVLEIRVDRPEDADFVQLCPEGELDAYSVAAFREAFAELGGEARLIVNLGGVQFMDSAGLGALIGGIRKVRENEGAIAVFCDRANITRLLHTTGFDRIVPVAEELPTAVAALDEPQS